MMKTNCQFEAAIAEKDIRAYSQLSGDANPLHLDPAYAGTTEFGRPIAHGAFLIGFVSRVLGMYIPGRESLILSMNVRFPKPLYYPAQIRVTGELRSFNEKRNVGIVHVIVQDISKGWPVVEAEVTFSCHQKRLERTLPSKIADSNGTLHSKRSSSKAGRLLITGATGGIGSHVVSALCESYSTDCFTRKRNAITAGKNTHYIQADLDEAGVFESKIQELNPADYYGVIHLSSPPMTRGFASDDLAMVRQHLRQSVEVPLMFAQWAKQSGSAIKRIILLGSTAGTKYPKPHTGAYSLGKAAMEHLVRLLPADLSQQKATINIVIPTLMPSGMNEGLPERARKALEARMPLGRLIEPSDIARVILFLLSPAAAQINGSSISVDGGFSEA